GIRPPNVLGAPKPTSSVRMSSTFGAPCGGTTFGGQEGVEVNASRVITPPNGAGGFGRERPSRVVVALGDPGVPVICWAKEEDAVALTMSVSMSAAPPYRAANNGMFIPFPLCVRITSDKTQSLIRESPAHCLLDLSPIWLSESIREQWRNVVR